MPIKSRVSKDQRGNSRTVTRLECRLEFKNTVYDATIIDLSSKGALISSPCQPAVHDEVKINLKTKHLPGELKLTGKILRISNVMTEYGRRSRFSVLFHECPLDLIVFVGKLNKE